mgnify:CR=1 FL=1
MTPGQLKASILQYAIQGKLVEQRAEEGSSEGLVSNLLLCKAELEEKKRILKKAPTEPFYSADDLKEWDIPDTWKWVQLSDVSIIQEGAGIRKWQYRDSGTQILCVTNILEGAIDVDKKELYISTKEYEEKYLHLTLNKGDIVTSCSGGSWGKIAFFDASKTMMLNTSTLRMRFFNDLADNNYLYYVCKSQFFKRQLVLQLSGMQPNFGYAHYSRIMIPLPPLAEQHRIVAKIEELLPYVDRYTVAYEKLEKFNAQFPEDMKKSILQYAIQGKLVEQRAEDGTGEALYQQIQAEKQKLIKDGKIKKEKPLADIADDEIPFDIPDSWKWVRLGDCTGYAQTKAKISPKDIQDDMWSLDLEDIQKDTGAILVKTKAGERKITGDKVVFSKGQVLYSKLRPYLKKILVAPDDGICTPELVSFDTYLIDADYMAYVLRSSHIDYVINSVTYGIKMPRVGTGTMVNLLIPLPPLAEQKRIVAKIEELLPLCERLK